MSRGWQGGSTRRWRKLRLRVLTRDGWRCRLRIPGTWTVRTRNGRTVTRQCQVRADCVHHTLGKQRTGDDPAYLVAACTPCNLYVGDPTKTPDPPPRPVTQW